MKKQAAYLAVLVAALAACEGTQTPTRLVFPDYEKETPEENRFVRDVLATNIYEPTELEVLPDGRVLFVERRGGVKLYNPTTERLQNYDSVPVFYTYEDGLMGLALDPHFLYSRWVYVYYSPLGDEPKNVLSRFRFTENGLVDEKVMLEVPTQREECCHTGGSIQFGSDGLLFLSTGDNTNPFFSDGFGPMDDSTDKSSRDARGTSSNTNDLRGKILRIKPEADGSYSIPNGNLFEDEDPLTRPEIYVMGCRNPYRIAVDPKRNWLFWGEVGPDAPADQAERGPRGHDEVNLATKAGYYGWPLFVGNNKPYRDYDYRTKQSGSAFDPANPQNDSKFNTGRQQLPPANPALIWYPYANSPEFPMLGTGGRNAMAGPVFYSDLYPTSATRLPAFFDGRLFIYDWIRGWIFSIAIADGKPADFYRLMPQTQFDYIIDMELGPDGSLYLLEYGTGWFTHNKDSKLSHIRYIRGNRPPVIEAKATPENGAAPLQVVLDASATVDFDGDSIRIEWEIGEEKLAGAVVSYTFEKEGIYYPRVKARDTKGNVSTQQVRVQVGNEAPVIEIRFSGNSSFYEVGKTINYEVQISDREDGTLGAGIDPDAVDFSITYLKGFDQTVGHQQPVSNGQTLMEASDCKACHKLDGPSIGPSYLQISERYAKTNSQTYLANKIRLGGGGVWGEHAMSAHPDLTEDQALQIVDYLYSLTAAKRPLTGTFVPEKAGREGQYLFAVTYTDQGAGAMGPISETKIKALRTPVIATNRYDAGEGFSTNTNGLADLKTGSWFMFEKLDLTGVRQFKGGFSPGGRGTCEVRSGSITGELLATFDLEKGESTGYVVDISASGLHDLYFVFKTSEAAGVSCSRLEFLF